MSCNYFKLENEAVSKELDLPVFLEFQLIHDVQVIRADDWQYECMIDGKVQIKSLTMMHALVYGVKIFRENEKWLANKTL